MDRSRTLHICIVCIALSVTLLCMPASWRSHLRLITLSPLRPLHSAGSSTAHKVEQGTAWLMPSTQAESKNAMSEEESQILKSRLIAATEQLHDLLEQTRNYQLLTDGRADLSQIPTVGADVILTHDPSSWRDSLLIARGTKDGIKVGHPVVWDRHLVGRISAAGPYLSHVELITDPAFLSSAVPLPEPNATGTSDVARVQGVYEGNGEEGGLRWIPRTATIKQGWYLLTAGDQTQGIPSGLILGRLTDVDLHGFYYSITVTPTLRHHNLRQVLVLLTDVIEPPERERRR